MTEKPEKTSDQTYLWGSCYDPNDERRVCGEHITDPQAPGCWIEPVTDLRDRAEQSYLAHTRAVALGGYITLAGLTVTGTEPVEVPHRLLAIAQLLAADLIEKSERGTIDLGAWTSATDLISCLADETRLWA